MDDDAGRTVAEEGVFVEDEAARDDLDQHLEREKHREDDLRHVQQRLDPRPPCVVPRVSCRLSVVVHAALACQTRAVLLRSLVRRSAVLVCPVGLCPTCSVDLSRTRVVDLPEQSHEKRMRLYSSCAEQPEELQSEEQRHTGSSSTWYSTYRPFSTRLSMMLRVAPYRLFSTIISRVLHVAP